MKTLIFNGKAEAEKVLQEVKDSVEGFKKKKNRAPKLVSIVVGDTAGNIKYSNLKQKRAKQVGIDFVIKKFPEQTSISTILNEISKQNRDSKVDGIMIQLPLPSHFRRYEFEEMINEIENKKDVDGMNDEVFFWTPVVRAVLKAIDVSGKVIELKKGTKVTVVGSNGFVGHKLVWILEDLGFDVAKAELSTPNLSDLTLNAQIIVSATGKANLIKPDMVKKGAVVIDVGAPKGDVHPSVNSKASFITPVPGGIGPLTIAYLLHNLVAKEVIMQTGIALE